MNVDPERFHIPNSRLIDLIIDAVQSDNGINPAPWRPVTPSCFMTWNLGLKLVVSRHKGKVVVWLTRMPDMQNPNARAMSTAFRFTQGRAVIVIHEPTLIHPEVTETREIHTCRSGNVNNIVFQIEFTRGPGAADREHQRRRPISRIYIQLQNGIINDAQGSNHMTHNTRMVASVQHRMAFVQDEVGARAGLRWLREEHSNRRLDKKKLANATMRAHIETAQELAQQLRNSTLFWRIITQFRHFETLHTKLTKIFASR